ncbi:MAG: ROK family protein, partial [Ignavibacteriales bacterium]|nr:ROK family protein [Ignavibacteriales bacterium]
MSKIQVTFGIDVGGTNTVFGLVDNSGKCYVKEKISTNATEPAEKLFENLFTHFNKTMTHLSDYEILGVGIGAPNANYYTGMVEQAPNLNWGNINLVKLVKKYLNIPVAITNDANAAALGEMLFGNAKGMKNFIEITLGTGLGSGIVVDGKLVYGHDGFAGEFGHTTIKRKGRMCGCGRQGCLEAYVSASGIVRSAFELLLESNAESV